MLRGLSCRFLHVSCSYPNYATTTTWSDYFYTSDDANFDINDTFVGYVTPANQNLAAGESRNFTQNLTIPVAATGKRYLLAVANRDKQQAETDASNNVYALDVFGKSDLAITNITIPGNVNGGESIPVAWTVTNQGSNNALGSWYDYVYASDNDVFDVTDTLVSSTLRTNLAAGDSYTVSQNVTVPFAVQGKSHLLVVTDRENFNQESNEGNNVRSVTFNSRQADLVVSSITAPNNTTWGENIPVTWTVTNQGNYSALGSWYDYVYASDNDVFDVTDTLVSSTLRTNLAAGASYTVSQNITMPLAAQGKSHLLVVTDRENIQPESNKNNNVAAITFGGSQPDLVVLDAKVPTTAAWGETVSVSWTVGNIGPAAALNDWYDYVYASSDDKFDINDTYITAVKAPQTLAIGASYTITKDITLPTPANGKPYLLFVTDRDRQQLESNEINNVKAVNALAAPDLTVTSATIPTADTWTGTIPITWTVKNDSTRAANSTWYDYVYASADSTLDATDIVVGKVKNPNLTPLAGGDSYTNSLNLTLPSSATNKPYLFIVTDGNNEQIESDETNNSRAPKATSWLHVATVLDPTKGMQLYLNGQLKATAATNLRRTATPANTTFSSATSALNGQLDEVSLWNVAKTATQIQSDYQKTFTGTESNLLSYWQLDEGVGATIIDSVSGTKNGILTNGTTWAGYSVGLTNDKTPVAQRRYTYDTKFSQLTSATDELGRKTLYDLDTNTGNVKKTTRIVGQLDNSTNAETNDVVTSYTYTSTGQVDLVTDPLGHITDYDYDIYGHLVKTTAAEGTIDQAVEQYEYDASGNQTASIDALGHRTKYIYNSTNMLLQSIDALGGITTYNYDKMGHQTSMTDALGHVTKMVYDSRGRLISTLDANGGISTDTYDNNGNLLSVTDALGHITKYRYDARNRLIGMTAADGGISRYTYDPKNNLTASIDANSHQKSQFYDSRNRVIRSVDGLGNETKYSYDAANQLISTIDAKGDVTTYQYDELGRLISTKDALGYITRTEYDKLGDVTAIIDANNNRTEYGYDNLNRRTSIKDASGKTSTTTYDKVGNIRTTTDRLGHTTSYNYDALNRQISVTDALNSTSTVSYNAVGNILSTTDALGRITSYAYDNLNRRVSSTDALNQAQTISYDAVGNVLTSTDKLGRITSYGYDSRDRQISTIDALNQTTSISYNSVGNILSSTDELGRITSYSYDANNRRVKTIDALNQQRNIVYDAMGNIASTTDELGRTTNYTYDNLDRRTGVTDALGHTSTTTYDGVGNTLTSSDALGNTTRYQYNNLNRRIQVVDALGGITRTGYDAVGNTLTITDSVGNVTSYGYDALNRQVTDTNSLGKTRSYGYDAVGDLTSEIDRNGRKRTYSYDALYRQTAEHWLDSLGVDIRTFNYSYDAVGHILDTNDADSRYRYSYDAVDRVTSVDNLGTVGVPNVLLNYSYDAAGNLLSVVDKINGVNSGTNAYTYDVLNRATRITQSGTGVQDKRVDMAYDAASQMTNLSRYGDLAGTLSIANSSYTYDAVGRLTNLEYKRGVSTLASYGLVYDAANRITQSGGTDGTQNYTYDSTNQLTGAAHTSQTNEAYSYDANGNRTNAGYGTGTNNQLLTDGIYNYTYDDEGNRTRRVEISTGKVTEYVWDYRNRLATVLLFDGAGVVTKTIGYTYDVNNRRISKSIDGATTERYVYDGSDIALVFDGAGVQTHRYLHGTGVDTVLADERGGAVVWALADNQGTVRDIVDGNGTILNHVTYNSFGKVVSQSNTSFEWRYGYTGREQDGETGLDYYRARYYDAGVGRFISEDPIGFDAGDSNLTRYVGNSPTNWNDPGGEVATLITAAGGAVLGAGIGAGLTLAAGGDADAIRNNAIKGAIQGGVTGLTLGVGGAAIAGLVNGGVAGGVLAGAVTSGAGNVAAQGYGLTAKTQCSFSFQDLGASVALGGIGGGLLLRPYTAPNQIVTSWAPKGVAPDLQPGRWVMTGQATQRNLTGTGTGFPLNNSVSGNIPSSQLAYPPGWESVKGLIGQRVIK